MQFTSSDPVEIEITKVYFNNKYGDEIRIEKSGTWESYYPDITPNAEYNGRITINSKVLENNAPKYIEFMVKNGKSEPQTITVVQYPLEYIVNERGFYSYKTSFDGTYEKDPKEYANKNPGSNSYATMSDSYFSAKHASYSGNTSQVYFYSWKSQRQGGSYSWELDDDSKGALHNSRIYHVRITKTSQEYTLGIPKLDSDGYTAAGEENSQMVSPSFMIASHLGYVVTPWGGKISWDYAKKHCKEYVEVAYIGDTDNTIIYDDWRLPTNMEIQIIDKFQPEDGENSTTAIDKILTGMHYWASNGEQETEKGTTSSTGIRCIRDAYIDKTVNNK